MRVNPKEAPEGFDAVEISDYASCDGCAFEYMSPECLRAECIGIVREDECNVIFVPRANKPAIANWPYDSEGTPV